MFAGLGRFAYRRRRAVVAFWVVLTLVSAVLAPRAQGVLRSGGFELDRVESFVARDLLLAELAIPPASVQVLFEHPEWTVDDPRYQAALSSMSAGLQALPAVTQIISIQTIGNPRLVSEDRRKTVATVALAAADDNEAQKLVPLVRQAVENGPLRATVTGLSAIYADIDYVSYRDLQRAEVITFPLALIALVLVFGSVVAAGVPVVVGGVTVVITLALLWAIGSVVDLSIFVVNVSTLLGLGVGIDYSLFMVGRFREELRQVPRGDATALGLAVERTVATAGKAVFFSGITVAIGLVGLFSFEFMMLRSVGLGGVLVVLMAMAASLTLMPALFGLLGHRIDALRVPWHLLRRRRGATAAHLPRAAATGEPAVDGAWARLARGVMRYPVPVFIVVLTLLLFLASPFLRVQLGAPDARILPPDIPSRQAFDVLQTEFGAGEATPLVLALEVEDGSVFDAQRIASLYTLTRSLQADPLVSRVDSLVTIDPRITLEQYQALFARPDLLPVNGIAQGVAAIASDRVTAVQIITPALTTSPESRLLVDRLRAMPKPEGWKQPLVTGAAAGIQDIVDELYRELPRAIGFIVLATGLSLLVLFRSVVVPIKAILMNLLSIGASFGALVFIFQDGNLSDLFRFQPLGYVDAFIPVILFCVLFGLSMDYEVFLLSRIKEAYDATGDNARSVELGLERTGRVITSAALILVVVAASFAFTDIILIKAIGLGVAIAIGLDATVVRTLLVPATMRLLGKWNWWAPSGVQRFLSRLNIDHR